MEFKNREEYEKNTGYIKKEGCPFCSKDIKKENKLIFETEYWIILKNKYPYFDEGLGLLVIPKRHIEFTSEIKNREYMDFKNIEILIKKIFNNQEYFSFIRQSKSNKSIEHLHYHYISGIISSKIIKGENYFKISYNL